MSSTSLNKVREWSFRTRRVGHESTSASNNDNDSEDQGSNSCDSAVTSIFKRSSNGVSTQDQAYQTSLGESNLLFISSSDTSSMADVSDQAAYDDIDDPAREENESGCHNESPSWTANTAFIATGSQRTPNTTAEQWQCSDTSDDGHLDGVSRATSGYRGIDLSQLPSSELRRPDSHTKLVSSQGHANRRDLREASCYNRSGQAKALATQCRVCGAECETWTDKTTSAACNHTVERQLISAILVALAVLMTPEGSTWIVWAACWVGCAFVVGHVLYDFITATDDVDANEEGGAGNDSDADGGHARTKTRSSTMHILAASLPTIEVVGQRLSARFTGKRVLRLTSTDSDATITPPATEASWESSEELSRLSSITKEDRGTVHVGVEDNRKRKREKVWCRLASENRALVGSAGQCQQEKFLEQCLAYANDDIHQAVRVATKFSKFRMEHQWSMTLSAAELEQPLRSKVHTVTKEKDRFGRLILTFTPGRMDLSSVTPAEYQKMLSFVLQEVLKDSKVQAQGLVLLVDARNVGFSTLRNFRPADYRRGMGMLSGSFPAKLKAIGILHSTKAVKVALSIALSFVPAKIKSRVEVVDSECAADSSYVNSLADPSVIPKELGIGGTWEGSEAYWDEWVTSRIRDDLNG